MSPDAILCADWSKAVAGREIYLADLAERLLRRVPPPPGGWTVATALTAAAGARRRNGVLLGFDAPLGVSRSYWEAARRERDWARSKNFADWLAVLPATPFFFVPVRSPSAWTVRQPFFHVPPGPGSRRAFEAVMTNLMVDGRREIDRATGGNPMFVTGGIPGSVGASALDLWAGLASLRGAADAPAICPFDGPLDQLLAVGRVVVGEIYPRLAYGAALGPEAAGQRSRLKVRKSRPTNRAYAIDALRNAPWIRAHGVSIHDEAPACESEHSFDALLAAAALLRCALEGTPLVASSADPIAEGAILGSTAVDLGAGERVCAPPPAVRPLVPLDEVRRAERTLLAQLRARRDELRALLERCSSHWGYEDPVYRFYHQSFKVYFLQEETLRIVDLLRSLAPDRELNPWFLEILAEGTGRTFQPEHNQEWTEVTRPIVEAFLHARFFLEMATRYAHLGEPPQPLPSGYAALLYLYGLR